MPPSRSIPTFAATVNARYYDESGHLDVRFCTEFGHEASARPLHRIGPGPRARRTTARSLCVSEDHIRYLNECHIVEFVEMRCPHQPRGCRAHRPLHDQLHDGHARRAAMQERGEGTVVVETLRNYPAPRGRQPARDAERLADYAFDAESGTLVTCPKGIGTKFDRKARKIMPFSADDRHRLSERKLHLFA